MSWSARQLRALKSICDTFAPARDGLPSASELGVPEALAAAIDLAASAGARRELAALLSAWEIVGDPGLATFSSRPLEERERALLGWADSRLAKRRAAFQALRRGTLVLYHMLPGPGGGPNPAWEAIGYPGPLGAPDPAPEPMLITIEPAHDTTLVCDVCVVGSGAGGAVAAAVLAEAGLDVVVLEAGGHYEDRDFDGAELEGFARLYYRSGAAATEDQGVGLLAGECLGGATVVNYSTSFRTPDDVREEWARYGLPAFVSDEFTESLDAVCERLGVTADESRPSLRDELMLKGLDALGWHSAPMPRNVRGCPQDAECGWCSFGCPRGAKQSTLKTWLADAQAAGARIVVRTRADRVVVDGGAATGVDARTDAGRRVDVRAQAVVVACGAFETPALLRRSGLRNRAVGRHLRLHPATAVCGVFEQEVRPWEGTLQAAYSDELRDLDGRGYGVKFETAPGHPHLLFGLLPWRGGASQAELVREFPRLSGIGILLRDSGEGEVRVGRDGRPFVRYRLSDGDARHLRAGIEGAARILEAAGARRIVSPHSRLVAYKPGREGDLERFVREGDACGYEAGRLALFSFHHMGSARMGGSPADSACNGDGETWEVRGLHVMDGSTFPTASGVNPMVTIEAVAHMTARRLAARLAQ